MIRLFLENQQQNTDKIHKYRLDVFGQIHCVSYWLVGTGSSGTAVLILRHAHQPPKGRACLPGPRLSTLQKSQQPAASGQPPVARAYARPVPVHLGQAALLASLPPAICQCWGLLQGEASPPRACSVHTSAPGEASFIFWVSNYC